jgi:methionyl-tRNA formyltransferase
MRMVERMDAGPVLHQVVEPISASETASDLWARLSEVGAAAAVEAMAMLELGDLEERPQDETRVSFAPRLTRDSVRVPWQEDAARVERHIRAMDAIPGAWTLYDGGELKVFRPLAEPHHDHDNAPGTVLHVAGEDTAEGMRVACGSGAVLVREVKPAGRRRMTTSEWVRGRGISAGDRLH